MLLETNNPDDLKSIISAISSLNEEATFVANSEGITFRGMDPSHVALIDISIPANSFEKYECESETKFGVRILELYKIIKRADKKDGIKLNITDQNMLAITMGEKKKYTMKLIESASSDTPLPKLSYNSKISMSYSSLDKILGDIGVITDYITITIQGEKTNVSGKGESGEVSIDINKDNYDVEEITSTEDSVGTYSLEYLTPMVKAIGTATSIITCELANAKPLRVEFKLATGRIHFYLAPRVETS